MDSGLKALDVPRLVRASDSEGDSIGLGESSDPVDSLICQAIQVLQKARLGVVYKRLKELGMNPICPTEGNSQYTVS